MEAGAVAEVPSRVAAVVAVAADEDRLRAAVEVAEEEADRRQQ